MPSKGTKRRGVRVDDVLWDRAKAEADRRNEALSEVIRKALVAYVEHRD